MPAAEPKPSKKFEITEATSSAPGPERPVRAWMSDCALLPPPSSDFNADKTVFREPRVRWMDGASLREWAKYAAELYVHWPSFIDLRPTIPQFRYGTEAKMADSTGEILENIKRLHMCVQSISHLSSY